MTMFESSRNTPLTDTVVQYFEGEELKYSRDEYAGKPIFRINFAGKNGNFRGIVRVNEKLFQLTVYFFLPNSVPEEKRTAAAEFLTRANYGLILGNFEMDFADGEVRYKTSIDCEGGALTPKMVHTLFVANLITIDRYFPGMMKVIWSNADPEEAIEEIESE